MTAFGHHADGDAPDRSGELHPARLLRSGRQVRSKELPGAGQDFSRRKVSSVEVFHSLPNSVNGEK
jgi:hypothetical protein